MTAQEVEGKLKEFQSNFDSKIKEFEVRNEAANKRADEYKKIAEDKEAEVAKFKEVAQKAENEKKVALEESRKKDISSFVESEKKNARLTPAQAEIATKLMESMTSELEVATFKQKDGKSIVHTQISLMKEFISLLPVSNRFSEISRTFEKTPSIPNGTNEAQVYVEVVQKGSGRIKLPVKDADIAAKIFEYQEEKRKHGVSVSYEDAYIEVDKLSRAA